MEALAGGPSRMEEKRGSRLRHLAIPRYVSGYAPRVAVRGVRPVVGALRVFDVWEFLKRGGYFENTSFKRSVTRAAGSVRILRSS